MANIITIDSTFDAHTTTGKQTTTTTRQYLRQLDKGHGITVIKIQIENGFGKGQIVLCQIVVQAGSRCAEVRNLKREREKESARVCVRTPTRGEANRTRRVPAIQSRSGSKRGGKSKLTPAATDRPAPVKTTMRFIFCPPSLPSSFIHSATRTSSGGACAFHSSNCCGSVFFGIVVVVEVSCSATCLSSSSLMRKVSCKASAKSSAAASQAADARSSLILVASLAVMLRRSPRLANVHTDDDDNNGTTRRCRRCACRCAWKVVVVRNAVAVAVEKRVEAVARQTHKDFWRRRNKKGRILETLSLLVYRLRFVFVYVCARCGAFISNTKGDQDE